MSDQPDKASKTEEATEKKIRDALEKGQTASSREVATLAGLIATLGALYFFLSSSVLNVRDSLASFIDRPEAFSLKSGADASALLFIVGMEGIKMVGPIVLLLMFAGVAASVVQNQPRIVGTRIEPKLERISLVKGWTRIFGLKGMVEFLKSVFKFLTVGIAGYIALRNADRDIINALFMEPVAIPELMKQMGIKVLVAVIITVAFLVAADIAWSRFSWRRDLRMTKQEVKDEHKQMEGDPLIRMKLRSMQRDRARRRMIASVPKATLIVANPTHYSVALRYVREEGGAPVVVAKGKDLVALKIRFIAEQNGIPIYEDRMLARSLYASVEVDKMIPPEFYKAVAGIILFFAQKGQTARPAM